MEQKNAAYPVNRTEILRPLGGALSGTAANCGCLTLLTISTSIMGVRQHPTLQAAFAETIIRQAQIIISDPTLSTSFLPSGRRFRVPQGGLNRFKDSFVPLSFKAVNGKLARAQPL